MSRRRQPTPRAPLSRSQPFRFTSPERSGSEEDGAATRAAPPLVRAALSVDHNPDNPLQTKTRLLALDLRRDCGTASKSADLVRWVRLDRTQEVGGSSPPSSIVTGPRNCAGFAFPAPRALAAPSVAGTRRVLEPAAARGDEAVASELLGGRSERHTKGLADWASGLATLRRPSDRDSSLPPDGIRPAAAAS